MAGVLTVPALPFFQNIGKDSGKNLEYAATILFCISFVLVVAVYVIYWKGPALRKRSPFAQRLANARSENAEGRRVSVAYDPERRSKSCRLFNLSDGFADSRSGSAATTERPTTGRSYSNQHRFFGENRVTPRGTPRGTPSASRRGSAVHVHK